MYQNFPNACFSFPQPMIQMVSADGFKNVCIMKLSCFPFGTHKVLASMTSYSNNFHSLAMRHAKKHFFLLFLSPSPASFIWWPLALLLEETSHKQSPSTLSMPLVGSLISVTSPAPLSSLDQAEEPFSFLVQKPLRTPDHPSRSSEPLRWTETAISERKMHCGFI